MNADFIKYLAEKAGWGITMVAGDEAINQGGCGNWIFLTSFIQLLNWADTITSKITYPFLLRLVAEALNEEKDETNETIRNISWFKGIDDWACVIEIFKPHDYLNFTGKTADEALELGLREIWERER